MGLGEGTLILSDIFRGSNFEFFEGGGFRKMIFFWGGGVGDMMIL